MALRRYSTNDDVMQPRLLVDIIVRPEYRVQFEQHDDTTFVHVTVHQWGHRIAARFRDDIDTAHRLLGRPVYALRRPEVPNQPKFLARHGFAPCGHVRDAEGRAVEVFGKSKDGIPLSWWSPET